MAQFRQIKWRVYMKLTHWMILFLITVFYTVSSQLISMCVCTALMQIFCLRPCHVKEHFDQIAMSVICDEMIYCHIAQPTAVSFLIWKHYSWFFVFPRYFWIHFTTYRVCLLFPAKTSCFTFICALHYGPIVSMNAKVKSKTKLLWTMNWLNLFTFVSI